MTDDQACRDEVAEVLRTDQRYLTDSPEALAGALLPLLARIEREAKVEALREAADVLRLRRLGMAFPDPWREGWNRALEVAQADLRAALDEPTGEA